MSAPATIAACFVGDASTFVILNSRGPETTTRDRRLVAALPPAGAAGIILRCERRSRAARAAHWITLRLRLAAARRRLVRAGAVPAGSYAVSPDVDTPTIVYALDSPAGTYAEKWLMPAPGSTAARWLRDIVKRVTRCDPSAGAVIVVGRRP